MNMQQVQRVRTALRNHHRPPRTPGARLRDAISHTKKSRAVNPAQNVFSQTIGAANTGRQRIGNVHGENSTPPSE